MYFNILAKIELAVFLEVHLRACYDFAWGIYHQNPSLPCGNGIPTQDHEVYQLNDNPMGAFLEGRSCDGAAPLIFDDADRMLNFLYMLVCCCKITCDHCKEIVGHNIGPRSLLPSYDQVYLDHSLAHLAHSL